MDKDLINSDISILGTYAGEALDTNITNLNGMDITRELIENVLASEEYERGIKYKWYLTYLGHPEDPLCADFERACCVLTDMRIEDNGKVYVTMDLLNTPVGRIVKRLQDAGVVFGISIRGAGDLVGSVVDPDTFMFRGFDLVAFPAYPESVPEFTAIAASTDPAQRQKYQRVCAAVESEIDNITSVEAIDVLKSQFAPNSHTYASLAQRAENIKSAQTLNIDKQKLEAMTDMYLDSQEIIASQQKEIRDLKSKLRSSVYANKRRASAIERITAAQMSDIQVCLDRVTASKEAVERKNSILAKQLDAEKKSNLIYKKKVNASVEQHNAEIAQKDSIIAGLKSDMRKTVTASREKDRAASDLGEDMEKLRADLEACEANLQEYQDAYANIYANALGVSVDDIQITSATTVHELQDKIAGATNSAGIDPSIEIDNVYMTDDTDDLITL